MRVKDLQEYYGGMKKADWDVGLAVDAIKTSEIVDVIIVRPAETATMYACGISQNQGRRVEVFAFGKSVLYQTQGSSRRICGLERRAQEIFN